MRLNLLFKSNSIKLFLISHSFQTDSLSPFPPCLSLLILLILVFPFLTLLSQYLINARIQGGHTGFHRTGVLDSNNSDRIQGGGAGKGGIAKYFPSPQNFPGYTPTPRILILKRGEKGGEKERKGTKREMGLKKKKQAKM